MVQFEKLAGPDAAVICGYLSDAGHMAHSALYCCCALERDVQRVLQCHDQRRI